MTALELSYYILNISGKYNTNGITPLKMQKLIYYVYVWGIVADKKIIDDHFVKWQYGPVNSSVYIYYKNFGKNEIKLNSENEIELSSDEQNFVNFIVSNYIKYDAITLSAMTHKDIPWQKAKPEWPIDENEIKKFYSQLNFAKNFPLNDLNKYYPVETDLHYAYLLDMPKSESQKPIHYNSYKEFLKFEEKNKKDFEEGIVSFFNK